MNHTINWKIPSGWQSIEAIDMHTAGEPLRILIGGLPEIRGRTILEKQRYFSRNLDYIRTGTLWEPRGHADMYGAVITEPVTPDGDIGVFFLHNEGYSTMCGHAIIAITRMVIETGIISVQGSEAELNIDAPPGRILARAWLSRGIVERVEFRNVPSFVMYRGEKVKLGNGTVINFDLAYGGAFYAFVDDPGLSLVSRNAAELIDTGRKIKRKVASEFDIKHPFEQDLGFLYGTIFTGKAHEPANHSRNVCIFADGELDRSPTGTGVSARAAIHHERGELEPGKWITIESILGTTMDVRIAGLTRFGSYDAVIPEVAGTSHFTGRSEFWFDPMDPMKEGFIIR
jgi:trans-L-3-hydroxyproline dehydratase